MKERKEGRKRRGEENVGKKSAQKVGEGTQNGKIKEEKRRRRSADDNNGSGQGTVERRVGGKGGR